MGEALEPSSLYDTNQEVQIKCILCWSLIVAINDMVRAIGCDVDIRKIRRCSDLGSVAADKISKAKFRDFHDLVLYAIMNAVAVHS